MRPRPRSGNTPSLVQTSDKCSGGHVHAYSDGARGNPPHRRTLSVIEEGVKWRGASCTTEYIPTTPRDQFGPTGAVCRCLLQAAARPSRCQTRLVVRGEICSKGSLHYLEVVYNDCAEAKGGGCPGRRYTTNIKREETRTIGNRALVGSRFAVFESDFPAECRLPLQ